MGLAPNEQQAVRKLTVILREKYGALDVRLYGSKARGADTEDSDIDILVVLPETSPILESKIDDDIFDINLEHDCLISTVYYSENELREGPMSESPLYKRAFSEGLPL